MEYLFPMIIMAAIIINATKKMRKSWDEIPVEGDDENQNMVGKDDIDMPGDGVGTINKKKLTPPLTPQKRENNPITAGDLTAKHPILEDFDLKKGIIYSEILSPKWKEYSK